MNSLFPTLLSKTLFIVCIQLFFVMIGAYMVLRYFRKKYEEGVPWITGVELDDGNIDLQPDPKKVSSVFFWTLFINFILFCLLIGLQGAVIGNANSIMDILPLMLLFLICSITDGVTIGIVLALKNEHLALKAVKLTLCAVAITMSLTCLLGLDFSFLAPIAFIGLLILLIINIFRIFKSISKKSERKICILGMIIFVGYLLIDFSRIVNSETVYSKDWGTALSLAIDIYLDVINLFLYILEFLGE